MLVTYVQVHCNTDILEGVSHLYCSRLSRSPLDLEGIESIFFRGPSHVGERVSLQSSANRIFSGNRCAIKEQSAGAL